MIQSDRDTLPFCLFLKRFEKGVLVACREGGLRKDERKKVYKKIFFFFHPLLQQSHPGERSKRDGATRREKGFFDSLFFSRHSRTICSNFNIGNFDKKKSRPIIFS